MKERLFDSLFRAPVDEVAGVESDAEKIGGDKSELGRADSDDTDDGAIDGGDDPALPELLADEHGGENGQNARQIIKPDDVEHIKHVGSMRQEQLKRTICSRKFMLATFLLLRCEAWCRGMIQRFPGLQRMSARITCGQTPSFHTKCNCDANRRGNTLPTTGVRMSVTHSKYSV